MRISHTNPRHALTQLGRQIVLVTVFTVAVFILWPQRQTLLDSFRALQHATLSWVGLALVATASTYVLATIAYALLVKHPVRWTQLWLVQAATALTSRLAPIGIGTMGLTAWFLVRNKHSVADALAVVTSNNAIGFLGHMLLLAGMLQVADLPTHSSFHLEPKIILIILVAAIVAAVVALIFDRLRVRLIRALQAFGKALGGYRRTPGRLIRALVVSVALSLVYVSALGFCAQALHAPAAFSTIFLIYTLSLFTGILTPTPGGLVGVEAGLVAGFVAYGYDARTALSIAFLYRLATYWLPLVPGFIAFRMVQRLPAAKTKA